jgi:hypothetical protein
MGCRGLAHDVSSWLRGGMKAPISYIFSRIVYIFYILNTHFTVSGLGGFVPLYE